jgi:hypothetical protein
MSHVTEGLRIMKNILIAFLAINMTSTFVFAEEPRATDLVTQMDELKKTYDQKLFDKISGLLEVFKGTEMRVFRSALH